MQRGVHLNKCRLDLMQNRGAKVVDFYCKHKKVRPLRIWSRRTVECHSNKSTPRLPWQLGLEWNKFQNDLSQLHQAFKSQACHSGEKLFFSIHFLCPAFLPHSLHSHILLSLQESPNAAHLISLDTIQYRSMSKNIAYGVHSVTTFVSVVVVMSGFPLPSIDTNRNHAYRWQLVTIPWMCTLQREMCPAWSDLWCSDIFACAVKFK